MNAGSIQPGEACLDAVICGGGPVGLSFAYLLGRAGLRVALFEKRASTTTLPKGQYVHASTAEFFRQWGVWDRLDKAGWSIERSNGQGFYVNIANGPVATIRATDGSDADYMRKWEHLSPAYPRKIPASDYEAAICRQASQWPNVSLHFATRVTDVERMGDRVRIEVQQTESQASTEVQARYLIACDGAHSLVRSRLASGQDHGPTFGNQVLVEFRAQLDDTLGRDGFFHSFILDPRYAGWFGSKHPETGLWRYSFRHDEDELPNEAIVLERIRGALGMPGLAVEIVQLYRFDYSTGLLRKWREGNVLFAGDAAHWHSPWGGFGMNSGVQDANNLAWKLALVARGLASPDLLDTYEVERKSKALLSVKTATYNSLNYQAIVAAVQIGEPTLFSSGQISAAGTDFLRQRVEPHGDNSVLHTGYQLGTVYESRAIIAERTVAPTPTLKDYVETTVPGVRAPHVWLRDRQGKRVSIIDLWGPSFVLLVLHRAEKWTRAAEKLARTSGVPLATLHVGVDGDHVADDAKFLDLYGADGSQAFLIRPDGFIARRFGAVVPDGELAALADTFGKILGASADKPAIQAVAEAADGA
ncbi:FAD-dependent monooxygenase [Lacisediminimonas sp.]|uniref:FAD-dependent monooxygenase n=1 Tax=Lacisediminimonas sp. TaxID=3060582 RepID=UPI002724FE77|nr:FAD-dependent monooxygenase [Lacisediminimonas sp.]MDO8300969.1 FAD-dependent monooxygenase [Lacisediminimonas sp.]